jgi:hypothetical protein
MVEAKEVVAFRTCMAHAVRPIARIRAADPFLSSDVPNDDVYKSGAVCLRVILGIESTNTLWCCISKPACVSSLARLRGRYGSAQCAFQAASTRSCRARSGVCHTMESQSTSSTANRPPGRSVRKASASAVGTSRTYSSTCSASAASNSPSAYGTCDASPNHKSIYERAAQWFRANASMGSLMSVPQIRPADPTTSAISAA